MSLPGSGKRCQNFELNLVPFIDLLSVNITFLLVTAVWLQTSAVHVEQTPGAPGGTPTSAPLTVTISADAVTVSRDPSSSHTAPALGPGSYDWDAVAGWIRDARADDPAAVQASVVTDDGVAYRHMVRALDLTRAAGFSETSLAGATPRSGGR